MKTFHKIGTFAIASVIALSLSASVLLAQSTAPTGAQTAEKSGQGRGHWGHGHRQWHRGLALAKLNLTDAQKAQAKQIRENHKATITALHQQIRAKQRELREAASGGNFNEALASQKLAEMAPLKAKLMAQQFEMRQEFMGILTPEQKSQLSQMRSEWKAKRAERRNSKS